MITDIFDRDAAKVLTLFSVSPGSKFTRNEIKEKTLLNNAPLDNALTSLVKNRLIRKEKRLLQLNFENESVKKLLEIVKKEHLRFREIPLKVYYALLDFSHELSKSKSVSAAYLFGSYAKLVYTDKSDVDVAVVMADESTKSISRVKEAAKKLEKKHGKILELHFYSENDMKQKDPLIKEIRTNGVEL